MKNLNSVGVRYCISLNVFFFNLSDAHRRRDKIENRAIFTWGEQFLLVMYWRCHVITYLNEKRAFRFHNSIELLFCRWKTKLKLAQLNRKNKM